LQLILDLVLAVAYTLASPFLPFFVHCLETDVVPHCLPRFRVFRSHGNSWNSVRLFSRPGKSWKLTSVMEN